MGHMALSGFADENRGQPSASGAKSAYGGALQQPG
jgi:hypothetical protein